ncbi:unnamed protein product, partial [Ilex paraguariensis]
NQLLPLGVNRRVPFLSCPKAFFILIGERLPQQGFTHRARQELRCPFSKKELHILNDKLQREQKLVAFWKHMSAAINPILIQSRLLFIPNEIHYLENRKKALLEEQQ